ncbi:MAG: glycoside hydrolase family 31 protein [Bacteroidota bacterium]|nr:glycoside hydrolase family 31 protein [Bacteroidota bacterium]
MKTTYGKALLITTLMFLTIVLNPNYAKSAVLTYSKTNDGVTFKLDKGVMQINVFRPDVIEVKYTSLSSLVPKQSLVVKKDSKSLTGFKVSEDNQEIVITTSRMKVKVNKSTNAIRYTDLHDVVILAEDESNGKAMTAATIAGIDTYKCETKFKSPVDEALFGLGCHPEDTLSINYKGRNQSMAIKYMTGAIPVLLSTKGYGLMWDNYAASDFYGTEDENTAYRYVSESGKMVDYYFFYGPEFDHIISLYRQTTGEAPMFGKWAFGLFQSQDRYQSQAEVLSVKDKYRNNKIPLDCIVQDWFYWEPNVIGSHVMDPGRYPNPKLMVDELHKDNVHAMISIWPVLAKGTPNYDELSKAGLLTDITWQNVMTKTFDNYYDAHNEKARQMYWKQAKEQLIAPYGWDAWWVDQCEPDNGALLDARRNASFATGKGIDYFNTYSLMHSTGLYNNWRKDIPGKRAFFLIRQSFAGEQRNAAALWSSDITCTFRAFKSQVPQAINACVSGIPYWTSDIGGYHYKWTAPKWSTPANRELFTRWFQFGVFSPIFRIHGKGERALFSDNWDAQTKAILLNYDNLRYRLLPYIYSLAWKVTHENYTIMRSLAFDFKDDRSVYNISDQYMFGPAFLVNPVTEQLYTGKISKATMSRNVYLPKSVKWIDFWTGKKLEGGQTIAADAPIETLPLYIKAGSIVPMGPFVQYATEKKADPTELRIYPGADAQFTIYEDENDNYNYEKGVYATIALSWNDRTKTLTIQNRKGTFPGMLRKRTFNVVLVRENHGVGVDTADKIDRTIVYDGKMKEVKF